MNDELKDELNDEYYAIHILVRVKICYRLFLATSIPGHGEKIKYP